MNPEGLIEKGMKVRTEQGSKANQRAVDETQGQHGAEPEVQRWTVKRRTALVVSLLRGETTVQEAARKHALTVAEVQDWRDRFLLGAENALRSNPRDEQALYEEQIKRLKQKIGDLVLDLDIAKEALKLHPFPSSSSED